VHVDRQEPPMPPTEHRLAWLQALALAAAALALSTAARETIAQPGAGRAALTGQATPG
jgi:truncated hemoglobin YjbI